MLLVNFPNPRIILNEFDLVTVLGGVHVRWLQKLYMILKPIMLKWQTGIH
jgi:hypothetical protein